MKRRMSHGHAMRSVFGRARVTHFIKAPPAHLNTATVVVSSFHARRTPHEAQQPPKLGTRRARAHARAPEHPDLFLTIGPPATSPRRRRAPARFAVTIRLPSRRPHSTSHLRRAPRGKPTRRGRPRPPHRG